jgi:hypothetical protein
LKFHLEGNYKHNLLLQSGVMKRFLVLVGFVLIALALSSCKPKETSGDPLRTSTPLPTSTAKEFPVVEQQACQLAKFEALRTREAQGDLLTWNPDGKALAYIGPAGNSNWFSGRVNLTEGPTFEASRALAAETLAIGDLDWQPGGGLLAFVAFRQPDTYTVMTVNPQSGVAVDLFVSQDANSDPWGGSKAIVAWQNGTVLRVLSSCGDDCDTILDIDTVSGQLNPVGEQLRKAKDRLWPHPLEKTFEPTLFPPAMSKPNWINRISPQMKKPEWSSDGKKVVYIDNFINAWVLLIDQKIQYQLNTPNVDVQEAKWAPDGRYLAVRTDDQVLVFDTECKEPR